MFFIFYIYTQEPPPAPEDARITQHNHDSPALAGRRLLRPGAVLRHVPRDDAEAFAGILDLPEPAVQRRQELRGARVGLRDYGMHGRDAGQMVPECDLVPGADLRDGALGRVRSRNGNIILAGNEALETVRRLAGRPDAGFRAGRWLSSRRDRSISPSFPPPRPRRVSSPRYRSCPIRETS